LNLLAAAAGAALAVYLLASIAGRGLFEYWGADFGAFRSAAEVARDHGYAGVYDLGLLEPPERRLVEAYASDAVQADFEVIPVPYFPLFLLPFRLTLFVDPIPGWLSWAALNALALLTYSRRLGKAFNARPAISALVLLVSLPAFLTLAFGQVNVWLLIGFGESLLALQRGREIAAGTWLGLLLLKPQILLLIVLGLVVGRRWRVLAGLSLASAFVVLGSLWLAGADGLAALASLWLSYAGDMPTTYPESMMNWRGLMVNLQPIIGGPLGVAAMAVGMMMTAVAGVWLWRRTDTRRDHQQVAAGSYAASSAVAWHSHVHMALPLVVLIDNGSAWKDTRARWLLWLAVVPALLFAVVGLSVNAGAAHRLAGSLTFLMNLTVLGACIRAVRRRSGVERVDGPGPARDDVPDADTGSAR